MSDRELGSFESYRALVLQRASGCFQRTGTWRGRTNSENSSIGFTTRSGSECNKLTFRRKGQSKGICSGLFTYLESGRFCGNAPGAVIWSTSASLTFARTRSRSV